jgi:hypothetical protein
MNGLQPSWAKGRIPPGDGWPQLATYPQSPFSGPVCCCDVAYLSQAFSQLTGPGRLWISLGAICWRYSSSQEWTESKHELKQ